MAKDKLLQLAECKTPIEAAVAFEIAIAEAISHYMGQGLTVSNAVGVLTCVTSEITLSFNLNKGMVDKRIMQAIKVNQ